jgi:hypothetical protein
MTKPSRSLALAVAGMIATATSGHAQQLRSWDQYCSVGSDPLCSSIRVGLMPTGGNTLVNVFAQNLEGTLGNTPWVLYNIFIRDLQGVGPETHGSNPGATEFGSANFLVTNGPDSPYCAGNDCTPRLGFIEWDVTAQDNGLFDVGSRTNPLPFSPLGITGCDAPSQPAYTPSGYWGPGYFQTCGGHSWIDFNFTLNGNWQFTDQTSVDLVTYDGASFDNCTFGKNCLQVTSTPEPASLTLMATGFMGVLAARRRRRAKVESTSV